MADIVNIITGNYNRNEGSSAEDATLGQIQAELQKKADEQRKATLKEQQEYAHALAMKGLKAESQEYKKLMENFQKAQQKKKLLDDKKRLDELYKYEEKLQEELSKERTRQNQEIVKSAATSYKEKIGAITDEIKNQLSGDNLRKTIGTALDKSFNNLLNGLNSIMDKYAGYQAGINARLQGSGRTFRSTETMLTTAVGLQPYIKNQTLVENLATLVDTGIAYNVELRAFIETVSDNIATTFDATNGTLLRLVRLQQSDSTAARLGLEASLTRYFNGMYQNTEYLSNSFDAVSQAVIEASSTMGRNQAISFEYQVQKWLGSLYSVGMSDTTVQGLAQALGYLGSGNIRGLSGSQYQNLLVMAANRAGLSYSDLLTGGLNGNTTNTLLASMVIYLKEIAQGTNQVVKSELAQTFGVGISDLTAALNISSATLNAISGKSMTYNTAMMELAGQLTAMPGRMSTSTKLSNLWSNLEWSLGTGVAQNPMMYAIWKVTDMIQGVTGGINIPSIFAAGFGTDLNTTVENLVKLGVVGASSLGMIGDLVSGLSSTAAPASMLAKLGAASMLQNLISLGGRGLAVATSGFTTSSTVYAGQSSGSEIAKQAQYGAEDEAAASADVAKPADNNLDNIHEDVTAIYDLLDRFISNLGSGVLTVSTRTVPF